MKEVVWRSCAVSVLGGFCDQRFCDLGGFGGQKQPKAVQSDLIAVPTSSRRLDCMIICFPFKPGLSSNDETGGTHRMLLMTPTWSSGTIMQWGLWCFYGSGSTEASSTTEAKASPAPGIASPHAARSLGCRGLGSSFARLTWVGDTSPTLVSCMLLWRRWLPADCDLWARLELLGWGKLFFSLQSTLSSKIIGKKQCYVIWELFEWYEAYAWPVGVVHELERHADISLFEDLPYVNICHHLL